MTEYRYSPSSVDNRPRVRTGKTARRMRSGVSLLAILASCVLGMVILGISFLWFQNDLRSSNGTAATHPKTQPHGPYSSHSSVVDSATIVKHKVTIHQPAGPPRVDIGLTSMHGEKLSVACSTCHTTREPNIANRSTVDLDEFHQGMSVSHGNLTCLACHNPKDYDTLHLADRTAVSFQEVMSLCSQCHGTQRRDYDHGAHGGMTGYWDLSRGPRVRNNCVDCHNPHQPKFPKMNPTFKPRDRFLESHNGEHHE